MDNLHENIFAKIISDCQRLPNNRMTYYLLLVLMAN